MKLEDITKPAVTTREDATLTDVLNLMITEQTNSLLVCDATGALIGEIGVPDILDAIVPTYLEGDSIAAHFATEEMFQEAVQDAALKPVSEFMSTDVHPIKATENLMSVAAIAIAQRRAQIPVTDADGHPIGVVSRRGLKHIIANYLNIADSSA